MTEVTGVTAIQSIPPILDFYFTVVPDVVDLDIQAASPANVVSIVTGGATPQPVDNGQEILLEASPKALLTSVNWSFSGQTRAVGSYGLIGTVSTTPPIVAPPSPPDEGANPTKFYLALGSVAPFTDEAADITLTATVPGVQGPLINYVDYPANPECCWGTGPSFAFATPSAGPDSVPVSGSCQSPTPITALDLGVVRGGLG
jgi:hypothetical protein